MDVDQLQLWFPHSLIGFKQSSQQKWAWDSSAHLLPPMMEQALSNSTAVL